MSEHELLLSLKKDIEDIKKYIATPILPNEVTKKWVSRCKVMAFLDYKNTQMCSLELTGELVMTQIGRRKFILRESFEKLLEKNILPPSNHNQKD